MIKNETNENLEAVTYENLVQKSSMGRSPMKSNSNEIMIKNKLNNTTESKTMTSYFKSDRDWLFKSVKEYGLSIASYKPGYTRLYAICNMIGYENMSGYHPLKSIVLWWTAYLVGHRHGKKFNK
jgi:hypothetical protein